MGGYRLLVGLLATAGLCMAGIATLPQAFVALAILAVGMGCLGMGNGSVLNIFVDGSLLRTGGGPPGGGIYGASSSSFRIGGGSLFDASGNYFKGQLDEVLLFDKALSTAQVQGLVLNQVPQ